MSLSKGSIAAGLAIGALNKKWTAHPSQALAIRKIFRDRSPVTFIECGRKFGKTDIIAFFLWRLGLTTNFGGFYYFTPAQNQAKEIVWATSRIQNFGPSNYFLGKPNNTEMRITLSNGSFLKMDGSDNFDRHRGTQPHGIAYDEFKDFRPEFHKIMGPNLSVFTAPLLICGTPPEELELEFYDQLKAQCIAEGTYFNFPTWANPHISRDWLRRERALLYARGEGDVWEREYGARRMFGGSNAIFPMFARARHVRPHAEIMAEIYKDRHKLIWQTIADPGNATVFGVVFRAINPYSKKVYRLGEIYECEQSQTSTSKIIPRIKAKQLELFPDASAFGIEWNQIYDEAATWFATEALSSFNDHWIPTSKALNDKNQGLSLIKDQMLTDRFIMSDQCPSMAKEIEGYIRKKGKIPKENDHCIDCDRYGNAMEGLDLTFEFEPAPPDPDDLARFRTPDQDWADESDPADLDENDW